MTAPIPQLAYRREFRGAEGVEQLSRSGTRFRAPRPESFRASVAAVPLGRTRILSLRAGPHRASWDPASAVPAVVDHLFVATNKAGTMLAHHDGRSITVGPGSVQLMRSPRSMSYLSSGELHTVTLQIPFDALRAELIRLLPRVTSFATDPSALIGSLSGLMIGLSALSEPLSASVAQQLESTVLDLVGAVIQGANAARGEESHSLYGDALASVRARLPRREITLDEIAAALAVTPQQLQHTFTGHRTTFRKAVAELRLQALAEALRSRDVNASLSDVAASVGYDGYEPAARAFRARFNITMGDYRMLSRL